MKRMKSLFSENMRLNYLKTVIVFLVCIICANAAIAVELIGDPDFRLGFVVKDRAGKEKILRWNSPSEGDTNQMPVWHTAQHHSKSCFADTAFCQFRKNGLTFRDDYQTLIVHPEDDSADIILGVNAMKEYGGVWRKPGDTWPHLYINQKISVSYDGKKAAPSVVDITRLDLNVSIRLLYDHQNKTQEFNPKLHTAQFLLFLTIQNLNRQSEGFGDYYWFGISFYDSRHEVTRLAAMQDAGQGKKKGTGKFIYNVGIAPFTSEVVANGKWVTVKGDILPHIRAGLEECWKRGYLSDSKDPSDYYISAIVIGWEIPGLNDAAIAMKKMSLDATFKEKEERSGIKNKKE